MHYPFAHVKKSSACVYLGLLSCSHAAKLASKNVMLFAFWQVDMPLSSQHPLCTTSFTDRSSKAHLVHINLLAIPINPPAPPPPIWLFIYILNAIVAAEFTALCLLAEESYHCKSARPLPTKPPTPTIPTTTNQRKPTARARERKKKKKKRLTTFPCPCCSSKSLLACAIAIPIN